MSRLLELHADLVIFGGEPAAFSAAATCLKAGFRVLHLVPSPAGLLGSSREIGLAHCELGEPWERLLFSLGEEHAQAFRRSARDGIDELYGRITTESSEGDRGLCSRGTRLVLSRSEVDAELLVADALARQQEGEQVRLMSAAAASNYAPVRAFGYTCLETHCLRFTPVRVLKALQAELDQHQLYSAMPVDVADGFERFEWRVGGFGVEIRHAIDGREVRCRGEVLLCCAGLAAVPFLGRLRRQLLGLQLEAFRSAPLRESTRTNVAGVTASWGHEQYCFDGERRLLGVGRDPQGGLADSLCPEVDSRVSLRLVERAMELFPDLDSSLVEQQWAYLWTVSCDGLPLLGPLPGEPRVWLCEGFGGAAWSRGYRLGSLVGESLANGDTHPLVNRCSPRRFQL